MTSTDARPNGSLPGVFSDGAAGADRTCDETCELICGCTERGYAFAVAAAWLAVGLAAGVIFAALTR